MFAVGIIENQEKLPRLYWLPKIHKRSYKARFTLILVYAILSKLLTSCQSNSLKLFTTGKETTFVTVHIHVRNSNKIREVLNK